MFESRGRIQKVKPIYLPYEAVFAEKLVMHAHLETLHGVVGLNMASIRVTALANPPTGSLPKVRTEGSVHLRGFRWTS